MKKKINKKYEKFIIILWKISIIISGTSFLFLLFVSADKIKLLLFIIAMFFGCIMFFIQSLDGKYIELTPSSFAEKNKIKYKNYEEVISQFSKNINFNKGSIKINDNVYGTIFYNVKRNWYNIFGKELFLIFIVNMKEYDNETLHLIIDKFEENIGDYVGRFTNNDYVEFTLITCLDHLNKDFIKYIDKDVIQDNNRIKLPVGIVFENNTLYIGTQKSPLFKNRYEKLKKYILNILK